VAASLVTFKEGTSTGAVKDRPWRVMALEGLMVKVEVRLVGPRLMAMGSVMLSALVPPCSRTSVPLGEEAIWAMADSTSDVPRMLTEELNAPWTCKLLVVLLTASESAREALGEKGDGSWRLMVLFMLKARPVDSDWSVTSEEEIPRGWSTVDRPGKVVRSGTADTLKGGVAPLE
jgi:hypothetical protein